MAKLYFKYGAMNAGKSMQLIAFAHSLETQNIPYKVYKSAVDTREGKPVIYSRPLGEIPCELVGKEDNKIWPKDAVQASNKPKWILVDEAQFLTKEQVERLAILADQYDINVMCYGLRSDFKTHLFEGSKRLFELADSISEIKGICKCGRKSIVNARTDKNGNILTAGPTVMVGMEDIYTTMCRKCYFENIKKE